MIRSRTWVRAQPTNSTGAPRHRTLPGAVPGVEQRDPVLGFAAVGRAGRLLRGGRIDDRPAARRARRVRCRPGRSSVSPGTAGRRSGRADGGRLPHRAHNGGRPLRSTAYRDAGRERWLRSPAAAAPPLREPRDDPRGEPRVRRARRGLVAFRVRGAGATVSVARRADRASHRGRTTCPRPLRRGLGYPARVASRRRRRSTRSRATRPPAPAAGRGLEDDP